MDELKKEIKQQEDELAKKKYTYDAKGEIVFVREVKVEALPKDGNYEIKTNLKKPPTSVKGIYAFQKQAKDPKSFFEKKLKSQVDIVLEQEKKTAEE